MYNRIKSDIKEKINVLLDKTNFLYNKKGLRNIPKIPFSKRKERKNGKEKEKRKKFFKFFK